MARHNEILSQEEVDALINGGAQEENALDEAPVEAGGVRDYDLANPERTVRSRLPTLELINERFTRRLRPAMHAYLRQNPDIFTGTTRILKYSEFLRNLVVPANLNIVQLSPLNGVGLIVYEPSLVFAAVENLFGGDGRYHVRVEGRDFTPTEQRIIESLVAITIKEYQSAWAPVYPLTLEYLRSEVSAQFANILSPAELVLTSTFNFEIGPTVSAMHVCLPYASLEPIRNILSTTHAAGDASPDERWIRALKQQLRHAEGGHDAHRCRRPAESADDDALHRHAQADGDGECPGQHQVVGQVPAVHADVQNRRRKGTHLGVGEVHQRTAAVDEHEAHGQQAVRRADDGAEHDDLGRDVPAEHSEAVHVRSPRNTARSRSSRASRSRPRPSKRTWPRSRK